MLSPKRKLTLWRNAIPRKEYSTPLFLFPNSDTNLTIGFILARGAGDPRRASFIPAGVSRLLHSNEIAPQARDAFRDMIPSVRWTPITGDGNPSR
jgi:hypothetical protein